MEPITVRVHARDPISEAGVASELRARPEVRVVKTNDSEQVRVVVIVTDSVDDDKAVETGVVGLVRRSEATPDRLVSVIAAAASGEGSVPPDLLGRLLDQVGKLQRHVLGPRGIMFTGLAPREVEVLRLLADGLDTSEIARKLAYSERTVKNVVHDVTTRLQLRNRSHAVAYALREGLI